MFLLPVSKNFFNFALYPKSEHVLFFNRKIKSKSGLLAPLTDGKSLKGQICLASSPECAFFWF